MQQVSGNFNTQNDQHKEPVNLIYPDDIRQSVVVWIAYLAVEPKNKQNVSASINESILIFAALDY